MKDKSLLKGYIYVILSAVMFGLMPLMAKFIYSEGVTSASLAFLRNLLSLPVILVIMKFSKTSLTKKQVLLPLQVHCLLFAQAYLLHQTTLKIQTERRIYHGNKMS